MTDDIDIEKIYNHWINTSEKDFVTMINLYKTKDFNWSLFIGQIVLERLLKASVVRQTLNHAPYTHDLTKLAKLSGLSFSVEQLDSLDTISTFNMNARYDSYKLMLRRMSRRDKIFIEKMKQFTTKSRRDVILWRYS